MGSGFHSSSKYSASRWVTGTSRKRPSLRATWDFPLPPQPTTATLCTIPPLSGVARFCCSTGARAAPSARGGSGEDHLVDDPPDVRGQIDERPQDVGADGART